MIIDTVLIVCIKMCDHTIRQSKRLFLFIMANGLKQSYQWLL